MRFFFFTDPTPTVIYTLSLHDALPILLQLQAAQFITGQFQVQARLFQPALPAVFLEQGENAGQLELRLSKRSEEHTSELQSRPHLVCRLLLEKKKKVPR